jgi:FkbM family methyltransferase
VSIAATPDDVRHAYRLLLGREPDAAGLGTYLKLIEQRQLTAPDIAALLGASSEYKNRQAAASLLDEVEFDGIKLYPWRGDRVIGDAIRAHGSYEPHMLPMFIDSIPVGGTVLDIGANIGVYTLTAARKTGARGRVIAVEPVATNVQSICAGIVGNGFGNVSLLPVAASSEDGIVPILREANSSNGIVDRNADVRAAESFVPAQRLDRLLCALERLDVIKIDIEGHEPIAWPSIEVLLRKHRPILFTEFNPVAITNHSRVPPEQYLDQIFRIGGTVTALHPDGRRIHCARSSEIMEQWREADRRTKGVHSYHLDLIVDVRESSFSG